MENLDWNLSDIIVSSPKTGTFMAVLAISVLSALASHHMPCIPMGLVAEHTSWLLPHNVNQ